MPVQFVEDEFGFRVAIGSRVRMRYDNGILGTVVAQDHPEYRDKFPHTSNNSYIPVIHDDGMVNGYHEQHLTVVQADKKILTAWLDKTITSG